MEKFRYEMSKSRKSDMREKVVEVKNVKWDEIGGIENVKREMKELVKYKVEKKDKLIKFGMKKYRGVLLYGKNGCGKNIIEKEIENECKEKFIYVKGKELIKMWFGEYEENVRDVFDKDSEDDNCVLLFDEMDYIAKYSGGNIGDDGGDEDRVINKIIKEMDGMGEKKNVLIIGEKKRKEIIEKEIMSNGRIEKII
jgi:transitional endoplasmic reticulum ATPase